MKKLSLPLVAGLCCALLLIILGLLALSKRTTTGDSGTESGAQPTAASGAPPSPSPSPTPTPPLLSWGGPLQPPRFDPYQAPAFRLSAIGGGTITNETVSGKPTILWFTTTYCVPCQLGAEEVKKIDDDLGGQVFNVVMIFIDPRETDKDLLFWKKNFANEDWLMTHGNEQLLRDYQIRSLDTQHLLDKDSLVREVNYGLVGYDEYKEKLAPLLR